MSTIENHHHDDCIECLRRDNDRLRREIHHAQGLLRNAEVTIVDLENEVESLTGATALVEEAS